jgi:RND family efflux transporter MFP subunit
LPLKKQYKDMKLKKIKFNNKPFKKITNIIKTRYKLLGLVAIVIVGLGYYLLQSQAKNDVVLQTVNPSRQNLSKTLTVAGTIDAKQKARMRFAVGGKVVYLGAAEGDYVEKWQNLATIDRRAMQKQLDQTLNTYMQERWGWENTLDANEDTSLDDTQKRDQDIEQFELNKKVLQVEIEDIAIRETALYAPFAGILTVTPTTVAGVQLAPTDFFELVNPTSLIFRAQVDENDIAGINLSLPANINLDAYPDEEMASNVGYISYTSAQTTTGTVFLVEMPISSSDLNRYRIGMNGDAQIILEEKSDVLAIPIEATRERDDKVFVDILIGENQTEERQIETGLETDDLIEVLSGLSESDQVVLPE